MTSHESSTPNGENNAFALRDGYVPGLAAELLRLHVDYYAPAWGLGREFEALVAHDFGTVLKRYDATRDQLLRYEDRNGHIVGTLVVEASGHPPDSARLRFFVLDESARGSGMGWRMLEHAIEVCRTRGQTKLYLTTFEGLDAARRLYERAGFHRCPGFSDTGWGAGTHELRYELDLTAPRA